MDCNNKKCLANMLSNELTNEKPFICVFLFCGTSVAKKFTREEFSNYMSGLHNYPNNNILQPDKLQIITDTLKKLREVIENKEEMSEDNITKWCISILMLFTYHKIYNIDNGNGFHIIHDKKYEDIVKSWNKYLKFNYIPSSLTEGNTN
jgi:hypothetical protein